MGLRFEWDAGKAVTNRSKHGVAFTEAATVFSDPLVRRFADTPHSEAEERFLLFGHSAQGRLLVVCYTERRDRIRIISARRMTSSERRQYEEAI